MRKDRIIVVGILLLFAGISCLGLLAFPQTCSAGQRS